VVICLEQGADFVLNGPADATATHCLLLQCKIQIAFIFLVPAHPGSPGQKAVKRVCVFIILINVT